MAGPERAQWFSWCTMLAALAASASVPFFAGPKDPWWPDARTTVLTFALTILAMVAGVGSLAIRETLVRSIASGSLDPRSPRGATQVGSFLFRAWGLCVGVALFGVAVAWVSAEPMRAWPYAAGALALLFFHAPCRGALDRV